MVHVFFGAGVFLAELSNLWLYIYRISTCSGERFWNLVWLNCSKEFLEYWKGPCVGGSWSMDKFKDQGGEAKKEKTNFFAIEMQTFNVGGKKDYSSDVLLSASPDYEVERITDYKCQDGIDYYFVKWKNWNEKYNTWEPGINLYGCKYLLKMFYLERRKLYFDARKVIAQKSKIKKRSYGDAFDHSLPPIPPDVRTMNEIMEEYLSIYPVSQNEFDEVLASLGTNLPRPDITKVVFSKLVGRAIFDMLSQVELVDLRKLLIKIEIRKRKRTVDFDNRRWELELNSIAADKPLISVENHVDLVLPPSNFTYLNYSEYFCEPNTQQSGCFCKNSCFENRPRCCGTAGGSEFSYNRSRHLVVPPGSPVYECNDNCDCDDSCQNRVVQDGYNCLEGLSFCIFRTTNRGWGVKTLKNIRRGAFVSVLVGEVVSNEEASTRHQSCDHNVGKYLFDLEFFGDSRYVVDFSSKGNISHFLNHSCSPNLVIHPNWYNHSNYALPRVTFYAAMDIPAETELTYSYVDVEEFRARYGQEFKGGNIPEEFQRCECGSANCVRFMIFPG
ncbi:unnamed protein product [Allacma fusca]|uniref:Histone-lysine N-methyltransferase n=1 Tax=Allacma fusca TaxID=39272 RepID=A0A8J2LG88_9HEXA|nr:unnamed protein product [Allacma fusca]